ncbi:MAG: hypothetical protein ABIJ18_05180 [archaeon]
MNKKATAPLLIGCGAAFILAVILFFSYGIHSTTSGNNPEFIGQEQFKVINTYQEGEEIIKFLEFSAILSAKDLAKDDTFTTNFEANFQKYIDKCNEIYSTEITLTQLNLKYSDTQIIAQPTSPIIFKEPTYTYELKPSFRIEI